VTVRAAAGGRAAASAEGFPAGALPALSVRGVNYYPRATPWGGMWTKTPAEVWEKDLALAASLNANTVRTFLTFSPGLEQAGLLQRDGAPAPAYLEKVESFLAAAGRSGIRAILCFDFDPKSFAAPGGGERWRRAVAAVVGAHREDARVLAWDLMNEPDDDAKWSEGTRAYLRDALALVRGIDTNHLTTVGMTWRIDRIREAGLPDLIQYHEYCPKKILFEQGPARVRQTLAGQKRAGGGRPVLIGEFGLCSSRDAVYGAEAALAAKMSEAPGTEADQERLYGIVLEAAEKEGAAGAVAWCLYDYPIGNPNESHFGLVRSDGTLKPAAALLKKTFTRWKGAGAP
jgi:hypothetical protein